MLAAWARATRPPDRYRWELRPEMNYLDDPSGAGGPAT